MVDIDDDGEESKDGHVTAARSRYQGSCLARHKPEIVSVVDSLSRPKLLTLSGKTLVLVLRHVASEAKRLLLSHSHHSSDDPCI